MAISPTEHRGGAAVEKPLHATAATVLVVDDDAAVRLVLRALVELAGYAVLEAADGLRALEIV